MVLALERFGCSKSFLVKSPFPNCFSSNYSKNICFVFSDVKSVVNEKSQDIADNPWELAQKALEKISKEDEPEKPINANNDLKNGLNPVENTYYQRPPPHANSYFSPFHGRPPMPNGRGGYGYPGHSYGYPYPPQPHPAYGGYPQNYYR